MVVVSLGKRSGAHFAGAGVKFSLIDHGRAVAASRDDQWKAAKVLRPAAIHSTLEPRK
jgi:hypothetical protein